MGTKLKEVIIANEIRIEDLAGKRLAVDSFNMLYQFLTTIRQQDGAALTDSRGRVTSHLSGLFFRTAKLMKGNVKLAFVFDGVAPDLKKNERARRAELKKDASEKYDAAAAEGDIELMKKYAGRTAILTKEMVEESKELISALGLPIIQAPSEGEAQASYMVSKGEFYAMLSQDTDGMLFGCPKIVKNLSISGKKRKAGTSAYFSVNPEIIDLSENLNKLGIDRDQLIVMGILCGTDFDIGGIKGIGPKKSLDLVKKYAKDFDGLFHDLKWSEYFEFAWKEVFDLIKNMPVTDDYNLNFSSVNRSKIHQILVERHEFSIERIDSILDDLTKNQAQKGLSDFF